MSKKRQELYTCQVFCKQDIREIIQLFQNNLQDVEIFIDNLPILDVAQLEQFDPTYQAKSLLARGYDYKGRATDANFSNEHLLVELKMSNRSMILNAPKERALVNPMGLVKIKMLLWRCQNSSQQSLIMVAFTAIFSSPITMTQMISLHYHLDVMPQLLVTVVGALLLGPLMAFCLVKIAHLLRMDTHIFLWPGETKARETYGIPGAYGTIIIALAIICLFVLLTFYLLQII